MRRAHHPIVLPLALLLAGAGAAASAATVGVAIASVHRACAATGRVHLAGLPFSYPKLNGAAWILLGLALMGASAIAIALRLVLREHRAYRRLLVGLEIVGHLSDHPRAQVIAGSRPQAFCAGYLRPRVYISQGALDLLTDDELAAVLAHEHHHCRVRDPLRIACGRILSEGLFFVPALRTLFGRYSELAEVNADGAALRTGTYGRAALASALLAFDAAGGGISPERVDSLLGRPVGWRRPWWLLSASVGSLSSLIALSWGVGQAASARATFNLPLLSPRPCLVMLTVLPVLVLVTIFVRRMPARRVRSRATAYGCRSRRLRERAEREPEELSPRPGRAGGRARAFWHAHGTTRCRRSVVRTIQRRVRGSIDSRSRDGVSGGGLADSSRSHRPAGRAFVRFSRAGLVLGVLGVASFVPVFVRLVEGWRVSPRVVSHHVAILGQTLSYPAANAGALIVLTLAVLGGIVAAMALFAIGRELKGARRLADRLAQLNPELREGVFVIDDARPEAFCAGLFRPRVYITSGALAVLDEQGLNAVVLHERHHAQRRDPLRLAASRVIARTLFFLPAVRELLRGQEVLAEVSADENAVGAAAADRSALARAMLVFSDASESGGSSGIDPARVDHLLGEPASWRFPALMCTAAVALLALVVTLAILVGREAAGSATLAPPFLSAQPCVVMLALIPCGVGLIAAGLGLTPRQRSRAAAGHT